MSSEVETSRELIGTLRDGFLDVVWSDTMKISGKF